MDEEKTMIEKVKEETERIICCVIEQGIDSSNVEYLGKVVDIHKDVSNEEYWEKKKEDMDMRYKNYGRNSYGNDSYGIEGNFGRRTRDSRGRYSARGRDDKYRGEDTLSEMYRNYEGYSEGKEQYSRGNYGAKEDTMESLDYMLQSVVEFIQMLEQDADSQEEIELIKHYTKKISDM